MILADLTVNGRPRKVLMQASKNGFFYVLDRVSGQLISASNYVRVNWTKGIDPKTGRPIIESAANYTQQTRLIFPSANDQQRRSSRNRRRAGCSGNAGRLPAVLFISRRAALAPGVHRHRNSGAAIEL
jgi:hypothetical protein